MTILKRKSFYVLVVAMVLCLVMAFVPFTSKTALAEISDPAISEGFTVKGAYVQLELGAEENPEEHTGKLALTFVASISETAYNTAAAQGELKLGLLVGPNKLISSVTDYATAVEAGFKAISNVGSTGSGASQEIVFTDGVAEIEAGIVYDESKLPGKLKTAAALDLVAIPFVTYVGDNVEDAADDTNFIYLDNAVDRAARPIVHEMYIRSSNFDYEKYPDDENKPVFISETLEKKFVVDVNDSSVYHHQLKGQEIYLDTKLDALFFQNSEDDRTLVTKDIFNDKTYFTWYANDNALKGNVYLAGVRHVGLHKTGNYEGYFTTLAPFGGMGNLIENDHIITKEQYTYSLTVFHAINKVETITFKAPTCIISSSGNGSNNGFVGPYDGGSSFNSIFGNSIASASDRYLQREIDGYYILANDINYTATQGYNYTGITKYVNRVDDIYANKNLLNDGTKGFTGVFDGRGFGIYDGQRQGTGTSTASGNLYKAMFNYGLGMFTWINGGTVKNLSFFNITLASQAIWGSVLAYSITGNSLIENVYVRPLVYATGSAISPSSIIYGHGSLLAQNIKDSTLRNVIVENDFMDAKDDVINHGLNNYQLFDANRTTNNVMENVISLGNSPVSWTQDKARAKLTMSVNELPIIDAEGTVATEGVGYLLGENELLKAQFGEQATFIVNECYGLAQNLAGYSGYVEDKLTDEITVTFKLNIAGVKQFSGYRDLAAYVNNEENEAVKTALVNSNFYNVAESGFVTPKHIPKTTYTYNNKTTGFGFGNRVDDAIIVVFSRFNNDSNPLYTDKYANEFIMADENGKFYVDFSKYVSLMGSTGRVWVEYSYTDITGQSLPTVATYEDCSLESFIVEVPAYDVTFQRISRAS